MTAPKIFISYAHEDESSARRLYEDLKRAGAEPWLDKENLLPGQGWKMAIESAIEKSDYFIALLSSESINKRGYVQKELRHALDVLSMIPPDKIYVIPVRINACVPTHTQLRELAWVDLFPIWEKGIKKIQLALEIQEAFPLPPRSSKPLLPIHSSSKVRVQFDFSPESMGKLDELVQTTKASTRSEVIRRALTLFTYLLEANQKGDKAYLKKQGGDLLEILLFQ
jgi:hypothetical protein